VSDFGLTVNAYTATHKYVRDGPKPIRYLSPEALHKNRYSEKSDVWALGVTVWELLTGGAIPFFDISDDDAVIRHVVAGGMLPPPENPAALPLWAAVRPCFARLPKDRPTFAQLGVTLGGVRSVDGASRGATSPPPATPAKPTASRAVQPVLLTTLPESGAEFAEVRAATEASSARYEEPTVLSVVSVQRVSGGPPRPVLPGASERLFHGTPNGNVQGILSAGFMPSEGGALGAGIYFSRSAKTAVWFARSKGDTADLLLCEVAVGATLRVEGYMPSLDRAAIVEMGFDSARIPAIELPSSLLDEETAVYEGERARPLYVVTVRFVFKPSNVLRPSLFTRYGIPGDEKKFGRAFVKAHRMHGDRAIRKVYLESDELANIICFSELMQHRDVEVLVLASSGCCSALGGRSTVDGRCDAARVPPYSGHVALGEMLRSNARVQELRLPLCGPGYIAQLGVVARGVARNSHLRRLFIYFGSSPTPSSVRAVNTVVCAMLTENCSLETVALVSYSDIPLSAEVSAIAAAKGISFLKKVDDCNLGREICDFLAFDKKRC
jgi:hypothetical protein